MVLQHPDLAPLPLPDGISESYVNCTESCGLNFHILTSGEPGQPLILFAHGFPELAYSWRKVMPSIAQTGFYCVAMDQRGYGRTMGWRDGASSDTDLTEYVFTNLARDLVCLVYKLGYKEVHCIVGHDFGAVSSAMAALIRPDMFKATIQMSHPHHVPPSPPFGISSQAVKKPDIQADLATLDPPRKHYKWYNSTADAALDWISPPQGLRSFLRGYFHLKSADWEKNDPRPLQTWSAEHLATMPEYYIMRKEKTMPETVADNMQREYYRKTERWLSPEELKVYCDEWTRTGFQGALNWYRAQTAGVSGDSASNRAAKKDMLLFSGKRIEVPCAFISGKQDWGNYQQPGALEGYHDPHVVAPGMFRGVDLIDGAGHWVQMEQPESVVDRILRFLETLG